MKQARGAASTKTKFKNLVTGATLQRTVQASESFDPAQIDRTDALFSYEDGGSWFFMDEVSYEEKMVSSDVVGDYNDWITEGMKVQLVSYEDKVIDINLPSTMVLKVR